jgi:hypothetical protein
MPEDHALALAGCIGRALAGAGVVAALAVAAMLVAHRLAAPVG